MMRNDRCDENVMTCKNHLDQHYRVCPRSPVVMAIVWIKPLVQPVIIHFFLLRLGPAALFSTHEAWFFDGLFQLISVSLTHSLLMRPTRYCRASTTWGRMSPPMRTYMISSPTVSSPSLSQTRM